MILKNHILLILITKTNIYIFPDEPHLLKLLRNWFIDYGFLYNGKQIYSDLINDLIKTRGESGITPLFKLSESHLNMTSQERQNVRRAAELISRTTAICIRRYYPDNKIVSDLALRFLEIVNLWFDVANSYTPYASVDYKKSYNGNDYQKKL